MMPLEDPSRLIHTLRELLRTASPFGGEDGVRDLISRFLGPVAGREVLRGRGTKNLVWEVPATSERRAPIGFDAHMDVAGDGHAELSWAKKSGVLTARGRGGGTAGLDDKLAVAVMIELARILREARVRHGGVRLFFTAQEERGFRGARELVRRHRRWLDDLVLMVPIDGHRVKPEESRDGLSGPLAVKFMNPDSRRRKDWRCRAVMDAGREVLGGGCPKQFGFSAGNELVFSMLPRLAIAHVRANYEEPGHTVVDRAAVADVMQLVNWLVLIAKATG